MQMLETNFFTKSNNKLNAVVKNTSCSHGWLRLVVQIIFGAITVGSFIMILHMAMQRPTPPSSQCEVNNCRVRCSDMLLDDTESIVIATVLETGLRCKQIVLTLRNSIFVNGTMPMYWMSRMPANVRVLNIVEGNLRHISSSAFVGQFAGKIRTLTFEHITISQWMSTTFVGLSSLRQLRIKNCVFGNIERNALRAIDDTIQIVTITHSGRWNPYSITGNKYLKNEIDTVDFSFNDFGNIIKRDTFEGLKTCKSLYLNSCKITAIGTGAFDPLVNIEVLFLSNNYLITVPSGLFHTFLKTDGTKPRIHLQNNPWRCDCFQKDLMLLSENNLLPVDTKCEGPPNMIGKSINELEIQCNDSIPDRSVSVDIAVFKESKTVFTQGASPSSLDQPCFYGRHPSAADNVNIVSPLAHFQCTNTTFAKNLVTRLSPKKLIDSDWLRPTLILRQDKYSMITVSSTVKDHGLIWYQSSCPNEIYCINIIPNFLRVYNIVPDAQYTFCPFDLQSFEIPINNCVVYNLTTPTDTENVYYEYLRSPPFMYVGISFLCLVLGAMCVYMIIRKNPILLKGSKRLLFVKHRNVDALVLPPKVPLRSRDSLLESKVSLNDKIFTLPDDGKLGVNHFIRSNSVRSDKSSTPTYVSAMQPTEAQLAEWRIRHHFDKSSSVISISSDISSISWATDCTSAEITTNVVYESLK